MLGRILDSIEKQGEQSLILIQRPLFLELTMLYDSLQHAKRWIALTEAPSTEAVADRLDTLQIELVEILARRDIRPFDETPSTLDPRRCHTVAVIPTDNPSEDNAVLEKVRDGFLWGEQVLRPADVKIKKYKRAAVKGE
jgi:molecular chaperone GrpE (heat shock protein)